MKEKREPYTNAAVIVARFQTDELTPGHKDLLETVLGNHRRVLVFLGVANQRNTLENPLDFKHRAAMLRETYPNLEIYPVDDNRSNETWSQNLDGQIAKWLNPGQTVTLYGARDSFLKYYSGRYKTCELVAEISISATERRREIMDNYPSSGAYRAGVISSTGMRYPVCYQAVDVAIFDEKERILLVRRGNEDKWRFLGGISDTRRGSFEEDARAEAMEEANLEIGDLQYVGSTLINDWRFKGQDKIKTVLFAAKYVFGNAQGGDDVKWAKWFDIATLKREDIIEEHGVLFDLLKKKALV